MVDSYTLGPISAGADSPLGGLLGFAAGLSNDYSAGLTTYTNNPAVGNAIIEGRQLSPAGVAAAQQAATTPQSSNPFVATGRIFGGLLGAGTDATGTIFRSGGDTAAPGVASGAGGITSGIFNVGGAGLAGGVSGALSGGLSGIGTALGTPGAGGFMLIAGGLVLLLLFLLLS